MFSSLLFNVGCFCTCWMFSIYSLSCGDSRGVENVVPFLLGQASVPVLVGFVKISPNLGCFDGWLIKEETRVYQTLQRKKGECERSIVKRSLLAVFWSPCPAPHRSCPFAESSFWLIGLTALGESSCPSSGLHKHWLNCLLVLPSSSTGLHCTGTEPPTPSWPPDTTTTSSTTQPPAGAANQLCKIWDKLSKIQPTKFACKYSFRNSPQESENPWAACSSRKVTVCNFSVKGDHFNFYNVIFRINCQQKITTMH